MVNGTVSLRVALLAAGIEAGDEVIVPPYTFLATATAVVEANATPIFADIELDNFNLDPRAIEAAITPRTKAVIPVHMGGLPVNMDAILDIARRHRLTVIEDAAHAHGAAYRGRRVGAIGQLGSFSFQSTKNLTSGEGGIILTNDDELAERCRSIHNCGRIAGGAWYEHHVMSGNYRLGEFQGAILNAQLTRFDAQAETRERNGKHLAERLAQLPGVVPQPRSRRLHTARLPPVPVSVSNRTCWACREKRSWKPSWPRAFPPAPATSCPCIGSRCLSTRRSDRTAAATSLGRRWTTATCVAPTARRFVRARGLGSNSGFCWARKKT